MSERTSRLFLGIVLITALALERSDVILAFIGLLLFEGLTNWRVPVVLSRLRAGRAPKGRTVRSVTSRIPFDVERALRLIIGGLLLLSAVALRDALWFFPWFIGFALSIAGITGVCPLAIALKKLGFRSEDPGSEPNDLTRTWQESIAVKITAVVVYAVVLVAFVITVISLWKDERRMRADYEERADHLAYALATDLHGRARSAGGAGPLSLDEHARQYGFSAAAVGTPAEGVRIGTPGPNDVAVSRLVTLEGREAGMQKKTVSVTLYHRPPAEQFRARRTTAFLWTGGAALLFGLFLTWVILKFIARPIHRLVDATQAVAAGNLAVRVEISRSDEFGILARFFNRMLDQIVQELTERKRTEEELRRSEEQLQTILDSIHAGIMLIDPVTHSIEYVNAFAASLIGAPKDAIVGRVCHRFVCPSQYGRCPITDGCETVDNSERVLLTAQGERVDVVKSVVSIPYKGATRLIESFIDIRDRKRAEENRERYAAELRESNEELKSFVYSAAHDLRAPLVNIRGFAGELAASLRQVVELCTAPELTAEARATLFPILRRDVPAAVDFIDSSVKRVDALINAMLKLSRIGHRTLHPEPVDLADLVPGLLQSFRHQMARENVTVTCGFLPAMVADRAAMEQILGNLLDNAVKYLNPGSPGRVEISAERTETETIVTVRDNGRGISGDDMAKLFKMFRRLGVQDVPGEGMGLAYVKALVRRHGGRIWCESEPGKGSTFMFTIPHVFEQDATSAAAGREP